MIHSMTAFARAETSTEKLAVTVEIRTYNSRYLDVQLRIPHGYTSIEEPIRGLVSKRLTRGRIEIAIQMRDTSAPNYEVDIDTPRAEAYQKVISRLKEMLPVSDALSLDFLIGSGGIIQLMEPEKDVQAAWPVVQSCLENALDDLETMRKTEGDFIAQDFLKRLTYIEKSIKQIKNASADLPLKYRERLQDRISDLTKGLVEIDTGRIAQEAAFLADRSDISEEIVRVGSHLQQFRDIMSAPESSGRKLNFLLQEFAREFNTMGAKAGSADISHIIVDVKTELEKIREQVQNVE